jgi:peptidoglycan/xylan/chitin deacetylase (PgdA/CDA1 family)
VHWLDPVRSALDDAPAPVEMFFRDDDGGWGGRRLPALLDLIERTGLPLDLAVIPTALDRRLAEELRARPWVGVHQHGYSHRNHEPDGRKLEFGPSRTPAEQRRDIENGAAWLADLLGDRVQPIFTPPWNRCTADTGRCLVELGFRVLSRESRAAPLGLADLHELPIRVDWFAHRNRLRLSPPELGARIAAEIRAGGTVGLMFHHAAMDAGDLRRADELLALLAGHPRVSAGSILQLTGSRRPPGGA